MDHDSNPRSDAQQPLGRSATSAHSLGHGAALPAGFRLSEFELQRLLGEGGFGIVYLAWDHSLDRQVALKEYLPSSLAGRVGAGDVIPHSERHRETFELGLRSFINEAKALAQFDHPSLVKVYRFWEAHGTAYMVMPFYEGRTVKDTVRSMAERPDERWLLALLAPLTDALAVVHAEHWFHRDIAPDNILLLADGDRPLLLDFGAARRVIGDHTQNLTVILKPGYAPVEQYAEVPGTRQGPWTDVYALAAVAYWIITGQTPPPSIGRMLQDTLLPASQAAAGRYSPRLLSAIDQALALLPDQRTPSMLVFRAALGLATVAPATAQRPPPAMDDDATVIRPLRTLLPVRTDISVQPASVAAVASPSGVPVQTSAPVSTAPGRRGWPLLAAAGTTLALAVAAAAWLWARESPTPPTAPSADTAAVPVVTGTAAWPSFAPPHDPAPARIAVPAMPSTAGGPTPAPAAALASTPTMAPAARPEPAVELPQLPPVTTATPSATAPPGRRVGTTSKPARDAQTAVPSTVQAAPKVAVHDAECARVLQQLSLGETSPDLQERLRTLRCR